MKRVISILLSAAILAAMTVQVAFAAVTPRTETGTVQVGDTYYITTFTDEDGEDTEYSWDTDEYSVSSANFSDGRTYVEKTYIDNSDCIIFLFAAALFP